MEVLLTATANLSFTFTGPLLFGTPSQSMRAIFDTGSFDIWVRSSTCNSTQCVNLPAFASNASSTFVSNGVASTTISYADGTTINGVMANDTIGVGTIGVAGMPFTLGNSISKVLAADSIIGIAIQPLGYFAQLILTGKLPGQVFSYFIGSDNNSGSITFGGIDISRYGGYLLWNPCIPEADGNIAYWKVNLHGIQTGLLNVPLPPNATLIADTGTSITFFPLAVANQINTQLGLISNTASGGFGTLCPNGTIPQNLPNITLALTTGNLVITPNEYLIRDVVNTTLCNSAIIGANTTLIIMGNALLRRFYTVFDFQNLKVGFAVANREPTVPHFVSTGSEDSTPGAFVEATETYPPGSNKTSLPKVDGKRSSTMKSSKVNVSALLALISIIYFLI